MFNDYDYRGTRAQPGSTSLWQATQPLVIVAAFLALAFGLAYLLVS